MVPENLLYTKEHEWILVNGSQGKVGITDFAQQQLGDVVYVELPKKGSDVKQMASTGVIESVKAVSELYAPISGKVVEVNAGLNDHPEKVNHDPYGDGWMYVIEVSQSDELKKLLKPAEYQGLVSAAH